MTDCRLLGSVCNVRHIHEDRVNPLLPQRALRAARIGDHAANVLTSCRRGGTVVSSFRCGITARFGDGDGTALLAIQTAAVAFHPWAVEVEVVSSPGRVSTPIIEPEPAHSATRRARAIPDRIVLHEKTRDVELRSAMAAITSLRIDAFDAAQAELARAVAPRLLEIIRRPIAEAEPACGSIDEPITPILARWRRLDDPEILFDLVGLGCGATPSGDDVLVGLLASLTAWEQRSFQARSLLKRLRADLPAIAAKQTALLSKQMLVAACERAFAEPLVQLIEASASPACPILEEAVRRITALGHTSGARLLQGFMLGWDPAGDR